MDDVHGHEEAYREGTNPPRSKFHHRRAPRWWGYTAFVLSGGGARGALQAGAVRALYESGFYPDVLVGTSIGAWNAAMLASKPGMQGLLKLMEAWRLVSPALVLLGREDGKAPPFQPMTGALVLSAVQRMSRGNASLYGDAGLRYIIEHVLPDVTFEDLALPLYVVATNISMGKREIFTSGPLEPALLASSAIPGIFPPVVIGDSMYVDGGVVDSVSVDTALDVGARRIFLFDVGYDPIHDDEDYWKRVLRPQERANHNHSASHEHNEKPKTGEPLPSEADDELAAQHAARARPSSAPHPLAALLERTVQVAGRYQTERALARVPSGIETHVLRLAGGIDSSALSFGHSADLIEHGYAQTVAYLKRRGMYREPAVAHVQEPSAAVVISEPTPESLGTQTPAQDSRPNTVEVPALNGRAPHDEEPA